ncbi:MAG: hypothetical protein ABS965_03185 [Succiniclasticum sp.]
MKTKTNCKYQEKYTIPVLTPCQPALRRGWQGVVLIITGQEKWVWLFAERSKNGLIAKIDMM